MSSSGSISSVGRHSLSSSSKMIRFYLHLRRSWFVGIQPLLMGDQPSVQVLQASFVLCFADLGETSPRSQEFTDAYSRKHFHTDPDFSWILADLWKVFCRYSLQFGSPFSSLGKRNMSGILFSLPCHASIEWQCSFRHT